MPPMCVSMLVQEHLFSFFFLCFLSRWEGGNEVSPLFFPSTHMFLLPSYTVILVNVWDTMLYKMGTRCFAVLNRPGRGVDHPPHLAPRVKKEQSYTSTPPMELRDLSLGELYLYLLTPWCRVLLEKLTGLQLVKKFPTFHETRRFITALTSVRHLSLSWASPIQSIYTHPTSWRSILILSTHLRLGLRSGLLPSGFPSKTL